MAVHDAFARLTPYELTFPDLGFARAHFHDIRDEAEARGVDVRDPAAFVMLAATGKALREIRGPEDDPALIRQYGLLLYHAFHFCEQGEPLWLVEAAVLRELLDDARGGDEDAAQLPGAAGYAQLPQHLVWVRPDEHTSPESLDGFHWSSSAEGRFELLLALGLRGDRPGLSVVPLSELPLADASEWARADMREGGGDFTSTLPGAELEGLFELRSAGEALKLAARVLGRLRRTGTAVAPEPPQVPAPSPPAAATPQAGSAPRPSALPYRRVVPPSVGRHG